MFFFLKKLLNSPDVYGTLFQLCFQCYTYITCVRFNLLCILCAFDNSDDENYVFGDNDSEDEDFVLDKAFDSEGNLPEETSEAEDEQVCSDNENATEEGQLSIQSTVNSEEYVEVGGMQIQ